MHESSQKRLPLTIAAEEVQLGLECQVTKREREIIHLMAEGLSTKEVAVKLHISFHTVETHRKNLLVKMKSRNMVQLVAKAIRFYNID